MPPHLQIQTLKNNLRSAERVIIKLKRMLELCRNPSTHLMPFEKPMTEFALTGQSAPVDHPLYVPTMRRYWYRYQGDVTNHWFCQYTDSAYQRQVIYTNEQPTGWADPELGLAAPPPPSRPSPPVQWASTDTPQGPTTAATINTAPRPSGRGAASSEGDSAVRRVIPNLYII